MEKLGVLTRKILTIIAFFFIFIALIFLVNEGVSYVLMQHKPSLEKLTGDKLHVPLQFSRVNFSWYGVHPAIVIDDIRVLNQQPNHSLKVEKLEMAVSLIKSLIAKKPILAAVLVEGATINMLVDQRQRLSVQGLPASFAINLSGMDHRSENFSFAKEIIGGLFYLSKAPNITVKNVFLNYLPQNAPHRSLRIVYLNFKNILGTHFATGNVTLVQAKPTTFNFAMRFRDPNTLADLHADVYLNVSLLSLSEFPLSEIAKKINVYGLKPEKGLLTGQAEFTWQQGGFKKIQTTLTLSDLLLTTIKNTTIKSKEQSTIFFKRLNGDIYWKRTGNTGLLIGQNILIEMPEHNWPMTYFSVNLMQNNQGVFSPTAITLGYINFSDLMPLLLNTSLLKPDWQKKLAALKIQGSLADLTLNMSIDSSLNNTSIRATFNNFGMQSFAEVPGFSNLSFTMQWDGSAGDVLFDTTRGLLSYDKIFQNDISFDQLRGDIAFVQNTEKAWVFSTNGLNILNNDVNLEVTGKLIAPQQGFPIADLKANIIMPRAYHITRYLPMHIFNQHLQTWLNQAFLGGEVKEADAILQGNLKDFPFGEGQKGLFFIEGQAKNVNFRYAPGWPILHQIDGKIIFQNRSMSVDVNHVETENMAINTLIHAAIPYFGDDKPQILTVQTNPFSSDMSAALKFIRHSPLNEKIGKIFTGMDLNGPMNFQLGLIIPLSNPDNTKVDGKIDLLANSLVVVPWQLAVDHLNGHIDFTENGVNAPKITGMFFNQPLTLQLSTAQSVKNISQPVKMQFALPLQITDLAHWLNIPFTNLVSGQTDITGTALFAKDQPIDLLLTSNLQGVAIKLPMPFGKKPPVKQDFSAELIVDDNKPLRLKMNYGQTLSAAMILSRINKMFQLQAVNIAMSSGKNVTSSADWPTGNGLYLTGQFDQLDWSTIQKDIGDATAASAVSVGDPKNAKAGSSADIAKNLPLKSVNVTANQINLGSQTFNNVSLQVIPDQAHWRATVNADGINGVVSIPSHFVPTESMTAHFDRLTLRSHSSASASSLPGIDPGSLPAMTFDAANFVYNDMPLGNVQFQTEPMRNGLVIRYLTLRVPYATLQAVGDWRGDADASTTHLQGQLVSNSVSYFLSGLGFDVHNFVSSAGNLQFNFGWQGPAYSPDLASLGGGVSIALGPGRIVDLGQSTGAKMDIGRLLSIFSLQAIPSHFTTGFSDIFQSGYSFTSVRGVFNLQHGNVYTNNLQFAGPVAGVGINGMIGLKDKIFDLTLSVTPYVTNSVPVAATFLGGPWVGLAALALNTVVSAAHTRLTTYYYAVTGPWSNPSWQPIHGGVR